MKRLNAKKIAAVVSGAALLGFGLAFASPIIYQSVPIINNAGQPVVQVVVGHAAAPSDGVAAGNIAAAIGNLAYTSTTKTVPVNATQASSMLHVTASGSSAGYTLKNQQVWLNESSSFTISGAYSFTALIGSVLNRGVKSGSPLNTKPAYATTSTYGYADPGIGNYNTQASPQDSPYTDVGSIPLPLPPSAGTNGGGIFFNSFSITGSNAADNILRVTSSNLPSLLNNYGNYGESESLWITGFPVYDQQSNVGSLALLDANGAYQVSFNKPIQNRTSSNTVNNAPIELLGQNWTIINYTTPGATVSSSSQAKAGGKIQLASSLTNLTTLYVGDNLTSGPFKLELTGLGNTNQNGVSQASINIYYQNSTTPVNTSVVNQGSLSHFNVSGHQVYVKVNSTFVGGSFSYQKWAKVQIYSNVYNITNGKAFNTTNDPNWYTVLEWTNSSGSGKTNALQSIILYGTTSLSSTLLPGQSFNFITNPSTYKLQFIGSTLGTTNYDPVTITSSFQSQAQYRNVNPSTTPGGIENILTGANLSVSAKQINTTTITAPAQELLVSSSIPDAFSNPIPTTDLLTYDLTPYNYTATGQVEANVLTSSNANVMVALSSTDGNFISTTYPLTVSLYGYRNGQPESTSLTFNANSQTLSENSVFFDNMTSIQMTRALPDLSITVKEVPTANVANAVTLGTLTSGTVPILLYTQSGQSYYSRSSGLSVTYNQQNGQPTSTFGITNMQTGASGIAPSNYYTYTINENNVPSSTSSNDAIEIGIVNSTSGAGASQLFQLNYTASSSSTHGTHNNVTYIPSLGGSGINAESGFITERGSKIASITPSEVAINMAKTVGGLEFAVSTNASSAVVKNAKVYGPFGVGQLTNIPNVSIYQVNATPVVSSGYTITGIDNLTSEPVNMTSPTLLKNLATTSPLVVLDSNINSGDSLILVGSGYVNTLSQQMEQAQNVTNAELNVTGGKVIAKGNQILVAGYTANQTTAAANSFIEQLYALAAK